ncbi:ABC transporter ATP-binding protein [Puia dinghuensis]|uniref:Long-chain-fatty-acid--CoA ligase n=1 Tax=Puia dinghuensis TaxID=1792502 RepID=A0A8J2XRY0_9BACT|nr:ABC transporter ATP-binding protein [Puia dinghuensis]GGB05024.1 long-chain-fatty-acid--CoA ligase [Puia dinghuensis]
MANPYLSLLSTAWRYARNERKKYILVYFMFICANLVYSLNPILFGWFIGHLQQDFTHVWHYALLYVTGYIGIKFVQWCFHGPARIMERTLAFHLSRNFLQEKYHQVLHLPVKWQQDHHSGATINRVRKAYEALREFFDRGFMYMYALTKFVFSVAAILYFSPLYGCIAVILGLATIFVIRTFDKPFIKALDEVNEREHVVSATLFDSLSNIMTVITLRLEKSMETGLLNKVSQIFRPFRKSALINEWKWFTAEMMIVTIYGIITLGYIFQHWIPGKLFYVGGLVTLLAYVNTFTSVFQDIAWQYTDIVQYNTYVQTASLISDAYAQQHRADRPDGLPAGWNALRISHLNFSYNQSYDQSKGAQSLHDLNITIRRGQRIALIGESGSGKSTLLALLRGLYFPEPGFDIRIDGSNGAISDLFDRVHEAVTLFPQEPEIFENTLAYNITLGLPFPEEEILRVCESAHFTEVIRQLPLGLESDIREKGVNLSGGQKQRLALARGILAARDSDLVLLDEPTSSVDPRTEAIIYEELFKTFADKAIISSIHRLHLLPRFDYIYVLHQGRTIAEGTFEHLRDHDPAFREMWRHQKEQTNV